MMVTLMVMDVWPALTIEIKKRKISCPGTTIRNRTRHERACWSVHNNKRKILHSFTLVVYMYHKDVLINNTKLGRNFKQIVYLRVQPCVNLLWVTGRSEKSRFGLDVSVSTSRAVYSAQILIGSHKWLIYTQNFRALIWCLTNMCEHASILRSSTF